MEVITEQLSHSELQHQSLQMLPDASKLVECKTISYLAIGDYFISAPPLSGYFGTEYKNTPQSV